jgi:hypothetical protein
VRARLQLSRTFAPLAHQSTLRGSRRSPSSAHRSHSSPHVLPQPHPQPRVEPAYVLAACRAGRTARRDRASDLRTAVATQEQRTPDALHERRGAWHAERDRTLRVGAYGSRAHLIGARTDGDHRIGESLQELLLARLCPSRPSLPLSPVSAPLARLCPSRPSLPLSHWPCG